MTREEFSQMLEANGIVFVGDAAWRVAQSGRCSRARGVFAAA
jgi:acetyl/propionyl-CoA carboxylase alpha subunit